MVKDDNPLKKRGKGRPRKSEIEAKKPGKRGKVGRPKGDAAIINDYKARMLASPKSEAVLHTLFDVALDPEHKHWTAATKMVVDRILPASYFEKDKQTGGRPAIEITITGLEAKTATPETDIVDVEYSSVEEKDA